MLATYRINSNEINDMVIKNIFDNFKGKDIEITINEIIDETDYLNSSEENRKRLLTAIKDIENGYNLKSIEIK